MSGNHGNTVDADGVQSPQSESRRLVSEAKRLFEAGNLSGSLASCKAAYAIKPSEQLQRRIERLEQHIADLAKEDEEEEEEEEDGEQDVGDENRNSEVDADDVDFVEPSSLMSSRYKPTMQTKAKSRHRDADDDVDDYSSWRRDQKQLHHYPQQRRRSPPPMQSKSPLGMSNSVGSSSGGDGGRAEVCPGFQLSKRLFDKLYDHQRAGVSWLYGLHKTGKGGILADDMGLGKTIQSISFIRGLFDASEIRSVLLIMPVSLIATWRQEFDKWAPNIPVYMYHGQTKRQMEYDLSRVQRRSGVLITTYGMVVSSWESLACDHSRRTFVWDYVILDEGHKIKNSSRKTSKGVFAIDAKHRIILTGTAVQNNLMELWTLFDFVHHGTLLGTQKTFKTEYERPINRSREKDATASERRYGDQMAQSLKSRIDPYFLRRTKSQIQANSKQQQQQQQPGQPSAGPAMPSLTRKNDIVVWLYMSETQLNIYRDFLQLDQVKALLLKSNRRSPLVELTVLKKICDHPRLLSANQCQDLGLSRAENMLDDSRAACQLPVSMLLQESCKMAFLADLLAKLKAEHHRTLIFSRSRKMLDIAELILCDRGHRLIRLDGRITQVSDRQDIVERFSRDKTIDAFLLTTQVGGVGLTLTAADRVVILDPSWNPAVDAQAVDRAFRIGQQRNVLIYRLITCGTIEEKIYRRQVFKDGITRQTTGIGEADKDPFRYFTKQELRELFKLDDPHHSQTQMQLAELHSGQRRTDAQLDEHLAYLHSLNIFGISDHDLMFSQADATEPEADDGDPIVSAFGGLDSTAAASSAGVLNQAKLVEQRRRQVEETLARENEEMAGRRLDRIDMSRMELSVLQPPGSARPVHVRERIEATMHQFMPLARPKIPQPQPRPRPPVPLFPPSSVSGSASSSIEAAGVTTVPSPPPSPPPPRPSATVESSANSARLTLPAPKNQSVDDYEDSPLAARRGNTDGRRRLAINSSDSSDSETAALDDRQRRSLNFNKEVKSVERQLSESVHAMSVSDDDDHTGFKARAAAADGTAGKSRVNYEDSPMIGRYTRQLVVDSDNDSDHNERASAAMEASAFDGSPQQLQQPPQKVMVPSTPEQLSDSVIAMSISEEDGDGAAEADAKAPESDSESDDDSNDEPIEVIELSSSDESLQEALQSRPVHNLLSRSLGATAESSSVTAAASVGSFAADGVASQSRALFVPESPIHQALPQQQQHWRPSVPSSGGFVVNETPTPPPSSAAVPRFSVASTPIAAGAAAAALARNNAENQMSVAEDSDQLLFEHSLPGEDRSAVEFDAAMGATEWFTPGVGQNQ